MAELFLATPAEPDSSRRTVVIKRLLPHMAGDPQFNAMFIDEARLSKLLSHPNIVKTYEFGHYQNELFIAMEYVEGLDALALLRECAHRKVRMPTEVAVYIVQQVLEALDYAHNHVDENGQPLGVVHRDISPSNVLLSRRGQVKLVDFGIARAAQQNHKTRDGTLKGKYGYMSPEQVVDDELDSRSDIFSVGIVLAELLTGRRLFAAPNELDVLLMVRDARLDRLDRYGAHIGMDLGRILRHSLAKSPDDRFPSAAQYRDALTEWLSLHRQQVTPLTIAQIVESLYEDAWKRKRHNMDRAGEERAALIARAESGPIRTRLMPRPPTGVPVAFVEDEYSEPSEIDGIPIGKIEDDATGPLVHIEASDGVIRQEIEAVETNRLPGFDRPVQRLTGLDPRKAVGSARIVSALPDVTEAVDDSDADEVSDIDDIDDIDDDDIDDEHLVKTRPMPGRGHLFEQARPGSEPAADQARPGTEPGTAEQARPGSEPGTAEQARPGSEPGDDDADGQDHRQFPSIDAAVDALGSPELDFDGSEISVPRPPANISTEDHGSLTAPLDQDPDDTGDFTDSPPIAVLYRLAVARATGLLVVSVGGICKHIYFRNGIPEYVSSNVATELFGEYLVKHGVLAPGELSMALAMMPHYSGKLGDTLVGLGLLRPLDVFRHLTRQVRAKLIDVCTWSKGIFQWYGGKENERDAFPLDLNAYEVLGAGAMALSEEVLIAWSRTRMGYRPRLRDDARVHPEIFQLGDLMRSVCEQLDGSRTLGELNGRFTDQGDDLRTLRALYLLDQTGLVELLG